jgi:acetyl esterase/lipase
LYVPSPFPIPVPFLHSLAKAINSGWRNPIQPIGAKDTGAPYDLLEGVQDSPITNYTEIGAWAPLSDKRILTDPRCRLMLHINWKAQTLPIILGGLPSKSNIPPGHSEEEYYDLPQPSEEKIREVNPRSKIEEGVYRTPTFLVHGTNDELIPWEQSQGTFESLQREGVESGFVAVQGAPHICDLSTERESEGWKAVERGYEFICRFV